MNFWKSIILLGVVIFLGWGIYNLNLQNKSAEAEIESLNYSLEEKTSENRRIKEDIDYLSNINNLVKELKSRFNYKQEGESYMKIITSD